MTATPNEERSQSTWRRRWPLVKKVLTYAFFVLVTV